MSATNNNYLTHAQQEELKDALAQCGGSADPQACKNDAMASAMAQSKANDDAMIAACAGGHESDACSAMVNDARAYGQDTAFAREVSKYLDGANPDDNNIKNVLAYDLWNSRELAKTSELENDPVLWAFDTLACIGAAMFSSGSCSGEPPPGSGRVDSAAIPILEYGAGWLRIGKGDAAEIVDDMLRPKGDGRVETPGHLLPDNIQGDGLKPPSFQFETVRPSASPKNEIVSTTIGGQKIEISGHGFYNVHSGSGYSFSTMSNLSKNQIDSAIANDIATYMAVGGTLPKSAVPLTRTIVVDGQKIEYRALRTADGTVRVSNYHPPRG